MKSALYLPFVYLDNAKRLDNIVCKAKNPPFLTEERITFFLENYKKDNLNIQKLIKFLNVCSRTIESPEAIKLCDYLLSVGLKKEFRPLPENQYKHLYHNQKLSDTIKNEYIF